MRRVRELGFRESVRQARTLVADRAAARFHHIRDRYFTPTLEQEAEDAINSLFQQPDFAHQIKTRRIPRFFLDHEPDFYRDAIRKYFPAAEGKIIGAANQIK